MNELATKIEEIKKEIEENVTAIQTKLEENKELKKKIKELERVQSKIAEIMGNGQTNIPV